MAVHYTSIGPINAVLHIEGGTTSARIVAFGWDDEEPETVTGYWMFGSAIHSGLIFVPASAILEIRD